MTGAKMLVLHDYQEIALQHLRRNPRGAIFLDMGLGKTAVVLRALTPEHLPVIVTAPKRVAENVWEQEARTWRPDLTIAVAKGSPLARKRALESGADIVVIGRDNLADVLPVADRFTTFVLDELSGFKSWTSNRFKVAKKIIAKGPRYVWGLTGTPAPQGYMDLWSQIYLLDGGQRLGKNITWFRSRYYRPGRQLSTGVIIEWIMRPEAEKHIRNLIDDICISMSSEGRIDLPELTFNSVDVPLPANIKAMYKKLKNTLVLDLDVLGGEIHTAGTAAVLSTRLCQVAAGFIYSDEGSHRYDILHKEKITALQEIIDGTGSPVMVFYRYRAEKEMIMAAIKNVHTIDEPGVIDDWNAGKVPILLAHPQSAGHGLNLQKGPGHTIVWTTLTWSLEEWEQANKRLHRQGQKSPVMVHVLVAPRTVDNLILDALRQKASVQDALLRHLESPI